MEEGRDYCIITPPKTVNSGVAIDTYDDHRMVRLRFPTFFFDSAYYHFLSSLRALSRTGTGGGEPQTTSLVWGSIVPSRTPITRRLCVQASLMTTRKWIFTKFRDN